MPKQHGPLSQLPEEGAVPCRVRSRPSTQGFPNKTKNSEKKSLPAKVPLPSLPTLPGHVWQSPSSYIVVNVSPAAGCRTRPWVLATPSGADGDHRFKATFSSLARP